MYRKDGPKYCYARDLQALWERGQSLVLYQHLGMKKGGVPVMVEEAADRIRRAVDAEPIPLLFPRGAEPVFFVLPQDDDKGRVIRERVGRFLTDPGWQQHFQRP